MNSKKKRKELSWKMILERGHKTRPGKRRVIGDSICDTKSCKFYGKPAAQGVCYSRIDTEWSKIWKLQEKDAKGHLRNIKEIWKKSKDHSLESYISTLEGYYFCAWMNYSNCLDEVVWLRAERAKLLLKLGKWKGPRR